MQRANIDSNGIHYGVVRADYVDSDVLEMITSGTSIEFLEYEESVKERLKNLQPGQDYEEEYMHALSDFEHDEETHEYKTFDKIIQTFWLGGALNLFVLKSPHTVSAPRCSPCIPNAGNLDVVYSQGSFTESDAVTCYDLPKEWYREQLPS